MAPVCVEDVCWTYQCIHEWNSIRHSKTMSVVDAKFCVLHSPPDYGHGSEARTRTKIGTVFKVLDTAYYRINKGDQAL